MKILTIETVYVHSIKSSKLSQRDFFFVHCLGGWRAGNELTPWIKWYASVKHRLEVSFGFFNQGLIAYEKPAPTRWFITTRIADCDFQSISCSLYTSNRRLRPLLTQKIHPLNFCPQVNATGHWRGDQKALLQFLPFPASFLQLRNGTWH